LHHGKLFENWDETTPRFARPTAPFRIAFKRDCSVLLQFNSMSYRVLIWVMAAAALAASLTVVDLAKEREDGPVFIASTGPITEDQVRQKIVADGWTNVLVSREGRYFQRTGGKDHDCN
jgi:hypothetical protein